jgi:hypothetical protein
VLYPCGGWNIRTELDWLEGYEWTPPYPGAGPVTPEWEVTPASVGQTALTAFDPSHAESNVLGNDYKYPDYARRPRTGLLTQLTEAGRRVVSLPQLQQAYLQGARVVDTPRGPMLWVGSPQKFLPPDGDYPGGSTGIPMDGYLAYETGWANDGPFHGELAPMQEAGIADKGVPTALRFRRSGRHIRTPALSILNPAERPEFDDWVRLRARASLHARLVCQEGVTFAWRESALCACMCTQRRLVSVRLNELPPIQDLGNQAAELDKTYDPNLWENPKQPLDKYNMGKVNCIMGQDCHDGTHQVCMLRVTRIILCVAVRSRYA